MTDKTEHTDYLKLTNEKLDSKRFLEKSFLVGSYTSLFGVVAIWAANGFDNFAINAAGFSTAAFAITSGVAKILKDHERTKAIQAKLIVISREAFQTDGSAVHNRAFLSKDILDLQEHSGWFSPKLPKPKPQPIAGMGHMI